MSCSSGSERQPTIIAVDQGTSATKALAVGPDGAVLAREVVPVSCAHPRPGWVEQDADELLDSVLTVVTRLLARIGVPVASLALSTQRESAIVWDRRSGRVLGPVLGWQDRRTGTRARELRSAGESAWVQARTGLPLDPMFSALKFEWLLDRTDPDRRRARTGEVALGTVDSFLLHHLTGRHRIEAGNASRTQLLDIDRLVWDPELLELFRVPAAALPEIVSSDAHLPLRAGVFGGHALSIDAVLGDSHAALYGHGVRAPGQVKVTYGSGSSIMGLISTSPSDSVAQPSGLATTLAWKRAGSPAYAFEGNILATGATLAWLGQILDLTPAALIELAGGVQPLHGINLVPAFAGLAAPWWSERAEAALSGITLGTTRDMLARAAVDSVVLQIEDVLAAAERIGAPVAEILADGGPSANDRLMQLQADLSARVVRRSRIPELSAFGVATLAAEAAGAPIRAPMQTAPADEFVPRLDAGIARARRASWHAAVRRSLDQVAAPVTDPTDLHSQQGAQA